MVGCIEEQQLSQPDPLVFELNRLHNILKEKERELGAANGEIKAMRASEVLKDKAVEELSNEVNKLDEKIVVNEKVLEQKNLEIKKLVQEKKDAFAAQYAAEAALRRIHANQKDDDSLPIASVIAPLEAEIKLCKNEIAALQEDKRAMERLTKSKELALLEAERILKSALERALIVEEVQNQNFDLKRQIEICQEENKILDRTNRQKVLEVEKLSQTIEELEETILAAGATANAVRDFRRQVSELNEEKRTLEKELARAKVSVNRVATVVANEWKDDNDKVMPVKQWLEERKLLQAEMQRLKDKLAVTERTANAESQLKEKLRLRLKTMEEGLKHASSCSVNFNGPFGSLGPEKTGNFLGFLTSNGGSRKRSTSQPRASTVSRSSALQNPNVETEKVNNVGGELKRADSFKKKYGSGESILRKGMWASKSKVADNSEKENTELKENADANVYKHKNDGRRNSSAEMKGKVNGNEDLKDKENSHYDGEDVVSGFLYDRLQKEVISLRKYCDARDNSLNAKDQEIQMLTKKVDALTKAIEVEFRKVKREAAVREKEAISAAKGSRPKRSAT